MRRELEGEIRDQLSPAWTDCWRALDRLGFLPVAEHVAIRWQTDKSEWTNHCDRVAEGRAFFRNIPTPLQAATRLKILEDCTENLQREMAWDDPLVMAAAVASGEALAGRVVTAEPERRTRNANGRAVRRPLITIEPALEFTRPAGTTLFLSTNPGVMLAVLSSDPSSNLIRAEVLKGANQSNTVGLLPNSGDEVVHGVLTESLSSTNGRRSSTSPGLTSRSSKTTRRRSPSEGSRGRRDGAGRDLGHRRRGQPVDPCRQPARCREVDTRARYRPPGTTARASPDRRPDQRPGRRHDPWLHRRPATRCATRACRTPPCHQLRTA